ncbi:superfamily II DNA or RNA helicase [Hypnocyclicus thermotrophus]|uniref:Superfamily II DNA or RNA helicase n=1 Tax=Hypnocyclicus thermotrophus TaxID=1627895 RepID=A0AA46I7H2_9FUSO|nr:DEAD/DEAH box helicase family protein [Hypnocyclicus thermotrophus]TDT72503.1 superfamily II DNA or RNA helicase [Hypnocyclicus thermotrophus]
MKNNFEKIDVFIESNNLMRIKDAIYDFERLCENKTKRLEVIKLLMEVKNKILSFRKDRKLMNTNYKKENIITPRDYQVEAINALKNNNYKGIFEMATGTGKTITSILCANNYYITNKRIFLIILVPFIHLIEQWILTLEKLNFENILKCFGNKNKWIYQMREKVRDYNINISKKEVIITTYKTASSKDFNDIIFKLKGKGFLIADECHYFGIKSLRYKIDGRLGLSATPNRWWDKSGTDFIYEYFEKTIYEYNMEKAITKGNLIKYNYFPIKIDLSEKEIKDYQKLTKHLVYLFSEKKKDKQKIEQITRKRSSILSKAVNKKEILFKILSNKNFDEISHTLLYCAPGEINELTKSIANLGIKVYRFDSKVKKVDREMLLKNFENGKIQILVAIKCLDEGVDVPSTKEAYFLSSTSNPREFIQRRGRILRPAPNKKNANIYDFIVIPKNVDEVLFKNIVSKEMPRFAEFSKYAFNEFYARKEIKKYLEKYNLSYLMDKLPWDIYNEFQNEWEDNEWI